MSKEMIISVNGREKKIAILDNGRVSEFYIERGDEENSGIVGNIYKGRVMRVLPGMQSAFVEIGLERDAFLYVSDFFDEEEEIERIVMEKSKKASPEEIRREANDQIQKARLEREKQMEAVQEIAEPMIIGAEDLIEDESIEDEEVQEDSPVMETRSEKRDDKPADEKRDDKRGRSRRDRKGREPKNAESTPVKDFGGNSEKNFSAQPFQAETNEDEETADEPIFESATLFEMDDSGFERIIDDEDTGDMFKDAYRQESIVDKVRAIEFDMESAGTAEVGSLLDSVTNEPNGFERIADDDDEPTIAETPKAKTSRGSRGGRNRPKNAKQPVETETVTPPETIEPAETESKSQKKGAGKSRKTTDESSEETCSVNQSSDEQKEKSRRQTNETGNAGRCGSER